MNLKTGVSRKQSTLNFPKNEHAIIIIIIIIIFIITTIVIWIFYVRSVITVKSLIHKYIDTEFILVLKKANRISTTWIKILEDFSKIISVKSAKLIKLSVLLFHSETCGINSRSTKINLLISFQLNYKEHFISSC